MNLAQMLVVMALLSFMIYLYAGALGFDITYMQALAGMAVLKGIALFLVPEKEPIVLVKSREYEEGEE